MSAMMADATLFNPNSAAGAQEGTEETEGKEITSKTFAQFSCRRFFTQDLLSVDSVCSCSSSIPVFGFKQGGKDLK